jgi:hypothetical protein
MRTNEDDEAAAKKYRRLRTLSDSLRNTQSAPRIHCPGDGRRGYLARYSRRSHRKAACSVSVLEVLILTSNRLLATHRCMCLSSGIWRLLWLCTRGATKGNLSIQQTQCLGQPNLCHQVSITCAGHTLACSSRFQRLTDTMKPFNDVTLIDSSCEAQASLHGQVRGSHPSMNCSKRG